MEFKEVLEILFIPEWSTHAYICKDGDVWAQLQVGKCYNKESFLNSEFSKMAPGDKGWKQRRLDLFDKLYEYYKTKYGK